MTPSSRPRPGETQSPLAALQQYPPEATATALKTYIDRYHLVRDLGLAQLDLSDMRPGIIEHLARLTRRYDVRALRRFPAPRRYALVLCFLVEMQKTLLDYVVAMHDQLLTTKCREARHVYEERLRTLRRRVRPGVATLIATGQCLLHPDRSPDTTLAELLREDTLMPRPSSRPSGLSGVSTSGRPGLRRRPPRPVPASPALPPGLLYAALRWGNPGPRPYRRASSW